MRLSPDAINGCYESLGSLAIWANVHKLWQDKVVLGAHWQSMIFWSSWSMWNLYYYPVLHQWFSFSGGCSLALANVVWTALAAYYMLRRKPEHELLR